nr:hormone sensitive lipase [Hymenolepis microstoma]
MANRERLGARPDAKVVICGDSAGGNLSLGVCLRAAALGLKAKSCRPSGALIAYAPAMVAYVPSPSRMLSICDPLLPIGVLSRCIIAYNGIDESIIDRQLSEAANLSSSSDLRHQGSNQDQGLTTQEPQEKLSMSDSVPLWLRLWSSWFPLSQSTIDPTNSSLMTPSMDRLRVVSRRFTSPCLYEIDTNSISTPPPQNTSFSPSSPTSSPSVPFITPVNFTTDALSDEDRDNNEENISNLGAPLMDSQTDGTYSKVDAKLKCIRNYAIPQDPFLSPYIASDELFRLLPPLAIVACQYDPFLDDTLEIAKRADSLGVPVEVHVAARMPHAFLNFAFLNADYRRATMQCVDMITRLFRGHT